MMTLRQNHEPPVACTLLGDDYKTRMAWILDLNAAALRSYGRDDLRLELTYAPEARDRVREMMRREQDCCAFLTFNILETCDSVRLTITAPERARSAADEVFAPFLPRAFVIAGCKSCPIPG